MYNKYGSRRDRRCVSQHLHRGSLRHGDIQAINGNDVTHHNGLLLAYLDACNFSPLLVSHCPSSTIEPDTKTVSPYVVGLRTSNVTATVEVFELHSRGGGA